MNDIQLRNFKELAQEIVDNPNKKNFKYRKSPSDIKFIYGNTSQLVSQCPNCRKTFPKNNGRQIVYFCSKKCRKDYRSVPIKFEVVR